MYHLPLLPGYDPNVNVRSSVPAKSPGGKSILTRLSEAEENGYEGTYFSSRDASDTLSPDGFIPSSFPDDFRRSDESNGEATGRPRRKSVTDERVAEVVFFAYGVVVFFGLQESQERSIIYDIQTAGVLTRKIEEDLWEIEECHYTVSSFAQYGGTIWAYAKYSMIPTLHTRAFTTTFLVTN